MTEYYKAFTSRLCSPLQGGDPVWDGSLPYLLPEVAVDTSERECAPGWNATRSVTDAMQIAGFWPDGKPVRVFSISPNGHPIIERTDKVRSATWNIQTEVSQENKEATIEELSAKWFGNDAAFMAERQIAWFRALGRPLRGVAAVEHGLSLALQTRELKWKIKQYPDARAAWAAWDARDARDARAAWDAWDARAAWAAWDARDARAAWAAWAARDARDAWAARAARDARDAWAARAALTVSFAVKRGWTTLREDYLTVGVIDAYTNGAETVLPTGPNELGYAMVTKQFVEAQGGLRDPDLYAQAVACQARIEALGYEWDYARGLWRAPISDD